jgi:DNA-binding transcriptional LysR family regulator
MLNITLEQARTLDAVVRLGSFAKAAKELHKVHSAVIYGVQSLEAAVGLPLFDRSGYRSLPTAFGRRVHEHCVRLLATARELESLCEVARAGYEPQLSVVCDGLMPVEPILAAVREVARESPATRVALFSEFLAEVEARAVREESDVMLTVVPSPRSIGVEHRLAPLTSLLVAHRDHPLAGKKRLLGVDLEAHPFLTVRGSDQRLTMSTSALAKSSELKLGDFHAKRAALLTGMGWGWMPEHLVLADVANGRLVVLRYGPTRGRHTFQPILHVRGSRAEGRAVRTFVAALTRRSS